MKWEMNRLEWSDVTCVLIWEVMLKVGVSFQQVIVSRETEGSSYPTVEEMLRRLSPEDGPHWCVLTSHYKTKY